MIMISLDLDLEAGASVGSPVGIDAPLRRIVAITQKNIAKDITNKDCLHTLSAKG